MQRKNLLNGVIKTNTKKTPVTEATQEPKKEATVEEILTQLVPQYGDSKKQLDSIKKVCDETGTQLKTIMKDNKLETFEAGGFKASVSITNKESFIEDALITKLKEMKVKGVIKKKEYVDMDALENAIYNNKVDAAQLANCKETKEVVTLRIGKSK